MDFQQILTAFNTLVLGGGGLYLAWREFQKAEQKDKSDAATAEKKQYSADVFTLVNELQEERQTERAAMATLLTQNRDLTIQNADLTRQREHVASELSREQRRNTLYQIEVEKRQASLLPIDDSSQLIVLIVEDEQVSAAILGHALKRVMPAGYKSIVVSSGAAGIQIVRQLQVALALVDLTLPGALSGIEFLKQVRLDSPLTRMIVISAARGDELYEGRPVQSVVEELGAVFLRKSDDLSGTLLPLISKTLQEFDAERRARQVAP